MYLVHHKIINFSNNYTSLLLIGVVSLLVINSNIHLPFLPDIQTFYQTSENIIQFSFVINPFIAMIISLIDAIAADFYGRKPILLFNIFLFVVGTFIITLADSLFLFFLGRFFQSLGDAGIAITASIILGDYYRGRDYAKIQTILTITLALAWAISPLLGGKILTSYAWKGNFILVFCLACSLGFPLFFWEEKKKIPHFSYSYLFHNIFFTHLKKISFILDKRFMKWALVQSLPLGVFTGFELILPFIYEEKYGYSINQTAVILFIFISINALASLIQLALLPHISLRKILSFGFYLLVTYLSLGLILFSYDLISLNFMVYAIFGLLAFALPFILIPASTKIADSHPQQLGTSLALLAIIRNMCTTFLPVLICVYSPLSFHILFYLTVIPMALTLAILRSLLKNNGR
jgi:DHA1 family bicyclomycin/chloramphenicol resistance-like MFS transporter